MSWFFLLRVEGKVERASEICSKPGCGRQLAYRVRMDPWSADEEGALAWAWAAEPGLCFGSGFTTGMRTKLSSGLLWTTDSSPEPQLSPSVLVAWRTGCLFVGPPCARQGAEEHSWPPPTEAGSTLHPEL